MAGHDESVLDRYNTFTVMNATTHEAISAIDPSLVENAPLVRDIVQAVPVALAHAGRVASATGPIPSLGADGRLALRRYPHDEPMA